MNAEIVRAGVKVWIHRYHYAPVPGVIVSDHVLGKGDTYQWACVQHSGGADMCGPSSGSSFELRELTVHGSKERAFYLHHGQKIEYRQQAADIPFLQHPWS